MQYYFFVAKLSLYLTTTVHPTIDILRLRNKLKFSLERVSFIYHNFWKLNGHFKKKSFEVLLILINFLNQDH